VIGMLILRFLSFYSRRRISAFLLLIYSLFYLFWRRRSFGLTSSGWQRRRKHVNNYLICYSVAGEESYVFA